MTVSVSGYRIIPYAMTEDPSNSPNDAFSVVLVVFGHIRFFEKKQFNNTDMVLIS